MGGWVGVRPPARGTASSPPLPRPSFTRRPLLLLRSDVLSVLQASVLGVDLRAHREYAFAPGEARALALSTLERDDSPRTIPCPRPPQCV